MTPVFVKKQLWCVGDLKCLENFSFRIFQAIVQTLCDANLCLSSSKSSENSLQNLANALPNEELLSLILTNILRLLSTTKQLQTWTQTTMGIRTMISLAEHDFGLEMIRM